MSRKVIYTGCDGDCFHCPYPDCLAPHEVISHLGKGCKEVTPTKGETESHITYFDTHAIKYLRESELL